MLCRPQSRHGNPTRSTLSTITSEFYLSQHCNHANLASLRQCQSPSQSSVDHAATSAGCCPRLPASLTKPSRGESSRSLGNTLLVQQPSWHTAVPNALSYTRRVIWNGSCFYFNRICVAFLPDLPSSFDRLAHVVWSAAFRHLLSLIISFLITPCFRVLGLGACG